MQLLLQIGLYNETPKILDILEIMKNFLPDDCNIVLKRWQEGKTLRTTYKSFNEFTTSTLNLQKKRFNKLIIESSFNKNEIENCDISIKSLEGFLEISPTNALWGNVNGYELESYKEESIRRHYSSLEEQTKKNKIEKYPNFLFLDIHFTSKLIEFPYNKSEALLKQFSKLIMKAIPSLTLDLGFFACADMGFLRYPRTLLHKNIVYFKDSYENKFDGLHDILIRKNELCRSFVDKFNNGITLFIEKESSSRESYGLIYILDKDHIDPKLIEKCFTAKELDEMYFPDIYKPPSHLDQFNKEIKSRINMGAELVDLANTYGTSVEILKYWMETKL